MFPYFVGTEMEGGIVDERCPICGSEDVILTGPLNIEGIRAMVTVVEGRQCTLCGNLQVTIPQTVLVRLYPPGVRHLTTARRYRQQMRKKVKRQHFIPI